MIKKKKLKGRKERIEDDLIWEERKIKWRLNEIAREEEGREGRGLSIIVLRSSLREMRRQHELRNI